MLEAQWDVQNLVLSFSVWKELWVWALEPLVSWIAHNRFSFPVAPVAACSPREVFFLFFDFPVRVQIFVLKRLTEESSFSRQCGC